jgi:amino acid adenylation domain-containing protein
MTAKKFLSDIGDPSSQKAKLLEYLLAEEGVDIDQESQVIARRTQSGPAPLSFAQQRLWILHQLTPDSPVYQLATALRLRGSHLNSGELEQVFNQLLKRHDSLRTVFQVIDGQPYQCVVPEMDIRIPIIDLTKTALDQREETIIRLAQEESGRPFDLSTGPLLRIKLIRIAEEDQVLLLIMHHIIADAWSIRILIREAITLRAMSHKNSTESLPELPIQYADFAEWQRKWLAGERLEAQLDYWKQQLKNASPLLELPTDRPRLRDPMSYGDTVQVNFSPVLSKAVKGLSQQEGVTLFMLLLAAFKLFLYRYTSQTDILIGVPIANREQPEIQGLIGFLVNTLPFRTRLSGNLTFRTLLREVQKNALDAYAHQDIPFEKLVQELNLDRDIYNPAFFQVMFSVQDAAPLSSLAMPGVELNELPLKLETAKFDFMLVLADRNEGLQATVEYKTDLFDATTIQRMIAHYEQLLRAIVDDPDQCLSDLPILLETELKQIVFEWNKTKTDFPARLGLAQLFEAQVSRSPDAVAVSFDTTSLTYRDLNAQANQLARHLQSLGVGSEALVGLCTVRSSKMLVGILGILKAGGAYLPLDPTYPSERLAWMMGDAGASVLVIDDLSSDTIWVKQATHVVNLLSDWPLISLQPTENLPPQTTADNLAYVMYTSGSTGRPKGISIPQKAVSRLVLNTNYINLDSSDVIAQVSNASFDAATFEIWGALLTGARLVGIDKETVLSPDALATQLREQEITTLFLTTALFNQMARFNPSAFSTLKQVLFGGEFADPQWITAVLQAEPPQRLLHVYGPTESTTFASWYVVTEVAPTATSIPIGHPLANSQIYLLDRFLQPLPVGVVGELYIGGDGLARGYWNQPGLTAERFLPSPFAEQAGSRLYRTGDLAWHRPDGSIEFLGRFDDQVKMRGYRIELGEIEALLGQHPRVEEAVILLREDEPGQKRLVAYAVPSSDDNLDINQLRLFLQNKLPDYMLPAAFVTLETMPLNPNGKIDRRALPAPHAENISLSHRYVSPRNPIEQTVADIWQGVLSLDRVGIYDNFFEIGGHSLLATQVISRVRTVFQINIPLQVIFELPTVAQLAAQIEAYMQKTAGTSAVPPLLPVVREPFIPLSFAQQRLWFLDQFAPDSLAYNISSAIYLRGPLTPEGLAQILNQIVVRHELLRTVFVDINGTPYQKIAPALNISLPVVDMRHLLPAQRLEQARQVAIIEAKRPFNLTTGPLLRATLFQLNETEYVLLFVMHHIISDGWSIGILFQEIVAYSQARLTGQSPALPDLPVQYADFALWQRQWLQGEVLEQHLAYWQGRFKGTLPVLELPTDRQRPNVQTDRGGFETWQLPLSLIEQLHTFNHKTGVTLFMTLVAAFKALLYCYTRQTDIIMGTPIAGRNHEAIENLIGFFVNTLALRTDLSGDPTFLTLVQRVQEGTLGAYAHQDLPFEKLVEELAIERSLSHTPLFQVMFALQNVPRLHLELPGFQMSALDLEHQATKFDMTLMLVENEQGVLITTGYKTDLFNGRTIRRMLNQYQRLLESIVVNPEQKLSELQLLTPAEKNRYLFEWNQTTVTYPQDSCIHTLFEKQVDRTPEAVALICGEQSLTYRELNNRANQLAYYLAEAEVGPADLVGVYLDHSIEVIIALLGILKAGATYVPLDPTHPPIKTSFMLEDAQVALLLTQQHLVEHLVDGGPQIVCLDSGWDQIATGATQNPSLSIQPTDLAYVIYTSGSTGQPKGVEISHRALVNYICWANEVYLQGETFTFPLYSSLSFDLTVTSIYTPLITGGQIVIYPIQGREIEQILADNQVDILKLTPSHLTLIKDNDYSQSRIKRLIVGGEALEGALATQIDGCFKGQVEIYNEYGPTEATVGCMIYRFEPGRDKRAFVPIGKPAANTQIYILDEQLQPVAPNVIGELYIAGDGLAQGYLNRPDLSTSRFVANPFVPGQRMYKTGDLARMLPDDNVEFIGRQDDQVKFHGYRVELNAIRVELKRHPQIRDGVVVVTQNKNGHDVMIAYYVSRQPIETIELREFLANHLIEEIIPNIFVHLRRIPLTLNGKVDYRGLPSLADIQQELKRDFVPPSTLAEKMLAEIWSEVLGVEKIGIHDNFFTLGGHSLLATQIVSRVRSAFQADISLRVLFEAPTIAEMVTLILQAQADQVDESELAEMLSDLEGLSSDEIAQLLKDEEVALKEDKSFDE